MYVRHSYAATHRDYDAGAAVLDKIPIFMTESQRFARHIQRARWIGGTFVTAALQLFCNSAETLWVAALLVPSKLPASESQPGLPS
jgi:hypothetical protein